MAINNHNFDLSLIKKLPLDVELIIQEFIPLQVLCTLNKKFFIKYHGLVKQWIPKDQYENYIRDMVRRDNDFVFSLLIC